MTAAHESESLFPPSLLKQCWFLSGPTASGKSAVSVVLAQRINAEIVSLDSMAIYRGMDVGTAKPTMEERCGVPHHMIDIASPSTDFSVAEFLSMAHTAATEILSRRRIPLFVGGTGLYLRSALRGLYQGPDADWDFRNAMQQKLTANGPGWLHNQLQTVDPAAAGRLHENDTRRVIRALEVFHMTGKPLSASQHHQPRPQEDRPAMVVWLNPPRSWLHDRINRRVDHMMNNGLLQETRDLLSGNPPAGRTARQALGYSELIDHLEGRCSLPVAVAAIKTGTRQFAKRQHTWFRNLEECTAVSVTARDTADSLCQSLLQINSGDQLNGSSAG